MSKRARNTYTVLAERLNAQEEGIPHKDGDRKEIEGRTFHYYKGRFRTLTDIAKDAGMKECTFKNRINAMGWPLEKALTTPVNKSKSRARKPPTDRSKAKKSACIHYQGDFHNCFSCPYEDCITSGTMRGEPNPNKLHLNGHTDDDPFCRPKKVTAALGSFGDYGNFIW